MSLFRRFLVLSIGSAIAMIAAIVLAGHIYGVTELCAWCGMVPMALPSAFCFLLTGAGFIAQGTDHSCLTN